MRMIRIIVFKFRSLGPCIAAVDIDLVSILHTAFTKLAAPALRLD